MKILRDRWVIWIGAAGVLLGGVALPVGVLWQVFLSIYATAQVGQSQGQPIIIVSNPFITLSNGHDITGTALILILAITGANVGGLLGILLGLIFSICKNRRQNYC